MKLFKEAHAEIQKAQRDSELTALSIDVRFDHTPSIPLLHFLSLSLLLYLSY